MRRIFKIKVQDRQFTMISMTDISNAEALRFVRGKWETAEVLA